MATYKHLGGKVSISKKLASRLIFLKRLSIYCFFSKKTNTKFSKKTNTKFLLLIGLSVFFFACGSNSSAKQTSADMTAKEAMNVSYEEIANLEKVEQKLVPPPFVPEHEQIAAAEPKVIQVTMDIVEKEIEVEPGVFIWGFTFHGSIPGPLIVAHVGDYVELTLRSDKKNKLLHNVDFHAATGALGGGELTKVLPGQEVLLRWKAVKAGTFVYHCAPGGTQVPWHVTHGMNGAVMILPRNGLRDKEGNQIVYDRAYYIGEQDYYLPKDSNGKFKRYPDSTASFADDIAQMKKLIPTHITFGEKNGALLGDNSLTTKVGETVLFIHSQANRPSYPHLIGGHADYVWERGNFEDKPNQGEESWVIAAGSAGAFTYRFKQPGTYVYLSHNLIEAFLYSAISTIKVEGEWDNNLMEQLKPPTAF